MTLRGPGPAVAATGMVAASHPDAVAIGVDVLRQGGHAVDAALATNAALGVLEPTACGIGGDLFALVWDASAEALFALDATGRAPRGLTSSRVVPAADGTIPLSSPQSWTVPGAVDGWFALADRWGTMAIGDLLAPAIDCAERGRPVPPVIAREWAQGARRFAATPGFAEVFMPSGRAPRAGEAFRNPALARAYRSLSIDGRDAFYRGSIAESLAAFSLKHGGALDRDDLARHRSTFVTPCSTIYHETQVFVPPPAGTGLAALQMLNLLEGFDLRACDDATLWHLLIESKKLAYEDRARYYADPGFAAVPVEQLLSKDYARERAAAIDPARAATACAAGDPLPRDGDTTYLATADADGNMVSWIQSNFTGFGSGYALPDWGFGLHNRGAGFSLAPESPNRLEPGKRPFHTIVPAFAFRDGAPWLAFGVMGGDMQPQGLTQVLVGIVDRNRDLQAAGDAPRFRHEGSTTPSGVASVPGGGTVHVEATTPRAIVGALESRGHRIGDGQVHFGGYQAVARGGARGARRWLGASESRKDGRAAGC